MKPPNDTVPPVEGQSSPQENDAEVIGLLREAVQLLSAIQALEAEQLNLLLDPR